MKNKLLVAAVVLVGLASVAYAAFTQTLTINGTGNVTGDWSVAITNITRTSATGATDTTAPTYNATSATFSTDLAYPGATATYAVTVTNSGSIDAKLGAINGLSAANAAAPTYVQYTVTGVTANTTTLAAGATNTINVTVTWDSATSPTTTGTPTKTATLTFDYAQNP
jgi:hypothetical protein